MTRLEGEKALLRANGVFRYEDMYTHNGRLFAKYSGGYVALKANGATSAPTVKLEELEYTSALFVDAIGNLYDTAGANRKLLPQPEIAKLIPQLSQHQ